MKSSSCSDIVASKTLFVSVVANGGTDVMLSLGSRRWETNLNLRCLHLHQGVYWSDFYCYPLVRVREAVGWSRVSSRVAT